MTTPIGNFGWPGHVNRGDEAEALAKYLFNPPVAQLRETTGTSCASGAFTVLTWEVADKDTELGWDLNSNPSRYTCRVAGLYQLAGAVSWPSSSSGQRASQWYVNGATLTASQAAVGVTAGGSIPQAVARTMFAQLAVGDYVELAAFQDTGGSLTTVVTGAHQSHMSVRWISL